MVDRKYGHITQPVLAHILSPNFFSFSYSGKSSCPNELHSEGLSEKYQSRATLFLKSSFGLMYLFYTKFETDGACALPLYHWWRLALRNNILRSLTGQGARLIFDGLLTCLLRVIYRRVQSTDIHGRCDIISIPPMNIRRNHPQVDGMISDHQG